MEPLAPDILDILGESHGRLRELADRLDGRPDPDELEDLFESLRDAILKHTDAEEDHFHVPLMACEPVSERVRCSVTEHREIDGIVERLERLDYGDATWLAKARHLRKRLLNHLDGEERELFPLAREYLPPERLREMAREYLRDTGGG